MSIFSARDVLDEINRLAPAMGVDPRMVTPLFMAENSSDGNAKTANGAATNEHKTRGIMQVIPATARGLQQAGLLPADWKHDPNDLSSQVQAGIATVKDMLSRAKNPNDPLELAATYNGGNTGKRNYLAGKPLAAETADYLNKVKTAANTLGITMPENNDPNATAPNNALVGMTPTGSTTGTGAATSSLTSTRRSVVAPGVMDAFTSAITDAINPGGTIDQAADAVIEGGKQRFDALANLTQAIQGKAAAAANESAAQSVMESTEALKKAQILTRLNMDPATTDNEAMKTANIVFDTDNQLAVMKSEIDKRSQVTMFDNPIEWLINQTRLPGMVQQYNNIVGVQNASIDHYKTLAGIRDSEQKVATGMEADLIAKKNVATKAKIAEQANEDLAKVQVDASAAATRDAMSLSQLANQRAQLAGLEVQRTKETQTERDVNNAKLTEQQQQQQTLDNYNKVIKSAGGAPIASWKEYMSLPPKAREELQSASTSGKFGKSFSESFDFINNRGNLTNMATNGGGAAVRQWMRGTLAKTSDAILLAEDAAKKSFQKFDPQKATAAALDDVQRVYQQQANTDMTKADPFNPFKIAYETLAKDDSLKNNPLAIFINKYGPSGSDPHFAKVDEQYLIQRFAHSVSTGAMPMADATKAITDFYKTASQLQITNTSALLFGMEAPEKTYQVRLVTGSGDIFRDKAQSVDLGNPSQVENFLTRVVAKTSMEAQQKKYDSNRVPGEGVGAFQYR